MEIRQRSRRRNQIIGAILFSASVLTAGFALWPTIYRTEVFSVRSDLLPREYQMEVQYPALGPSGDTVTLTVSLKPVDSSSAPNPSPSAIGALVGEVQSSTMIVDPSGQISTAMPAGKTLHLSWRAQSQTTGDQELNLFLFKEGAEQANGVYLQQPIWARSFPLKTFTGPGGMRIPILYISSFGILFGLGFLLMNLAPRNPSHSRAPADRKISG
jgi:hypothetical protein